MSASPPPTETALPRLWRSVEWRTCLKAVAISWTTVGSGIGLMTMAGWLITDASLRPPVLALAVAAASVQSLALGRGVGRYAARLVLHATALRYLGRIRLWLYDRLEPLVPAAVPRTGEVVNRLVTDADVVANGRIRGAAAITDAVGAWLIGTLAAIAIQPVLGMIVAAGTAAAQGIALWSTTVHERAEQRLSEARALLNAQVFEAFSALPELLVYDRSDVLDTVVRHATAETRPHEVRHALTVGLTRMLISIISGGTLVLVLLIGRHLAARGAINGTSVAAAAFLVLAVGEVCLALPDGLQNIGRARGAARNLSAVASRPLPSREPAVAGVPPNRPAQLLARDIVVRRSQQADSVSPATGVTEFRYPTVHVPPRARLVVTGPNGSGKSTLSYVLLHFLEPLSGAVMLGDVPLHTLRRTQIAEVVGWMPDEVYIFTATVRDNVRLAAPTASDDACKTALSRVGLAQWLTSLPNGLDTILGAGGRQLSSGERQRLGLARLLLTAVDIVLLDEPAAHIEPHDVPRLLAEIDAAFTEKSLVVMTPEGIDIPLRADATLVLGR